MNQEKFVVIKTQVIEFLGMKIDSRTIPISVPEEKTAKIKLKCLEFYQSHDVSILELTKVLFHFPRFKQFSSLPLPLAGAELDPEGKRVILRKHCPK